MRTHYPRTLADELGIVEQEATRFDADGITLRDVLRSLAAETGLPCVGGLPIGHGVVNVPVALGRHARLDGGAGTLAFLEPAVAG